MKQAINVVLVRGLPRPITQRVHVGIWYMLEPSSRYTGVYTIYLHGPFGLGMMAFIYGIRLMEKPMEKKA